MWANVTNRPEPGSTRPECSRRSSAPVARITTYLVTRPGALNCDRLTIFGIRYDPTGWALPATWAPSAGEPTSTGPPTCLADPR